MIAIRWDVDVALDEVGWCERSGECSGCTVL